MKNTIDRLKEMKEMADRYNSALETAVDIVTELEARGWRFILDDYGRAIGVTPLED